MPGIFLFLKKKNKNWATTKDDTDGTEKQLTQGLWVCRFGGARESGTRRTNGRGRPAPRTRLCSCTDQPRADSFRKGAATLTRRVQPSIQCFHHWATNLLVWQVREKYLALQLLPPPPPQNCSRFDFNAFLCSFVFSCKNLTVLECLYFIKCV